MTTAIASRAFELADPDAVFDFYYRQGWTDGLPIVVPTRIQNRIKDWRENGSHFFG